MAGSRGKTNAGHPRRILPAVQAKLARHRQDLELLQAVLEAPDGRYYLTVDGEADPAVRSCLQRGFIKLHAEPETAAVDGPPRRWVAATEEGRNMLRRPVQRARDEASPQD